MIGLIKCGAVGVLILSFLLSAPKEGAMAVNFKVKHNGQEKPVPDHVTLSFDDQSVQIPVRDGKFEVPPEVARAQKITFAVEVEGYQITVHDLSSTKLSQEYWTLLLAERDYGEDFESVVPKGINISSSCILEFESKYTDPGTLVVVSHCRSKLK